MYFPEESNSGLQLMRPRILPTLDRHFRPAVLANRAFAAQATVPVDVVLERAQGSASRFHTRLVPHGQPEARGNFRYIERWLKSVSYTHLTLPTILRV